jgi:hypothetical protein
MEFCLIAIDDVDQGLLERDLSDARHVKAVHVVPPVDLVVLVLPVLDGTHVQGGAIRKHEAVRSEVLVPE